MRSNLLFKSAILLLLIILTSCGSDNSTNPDKSFKYTKDFTQEIVIENEHTVTINNNYGGIIVHGWSQDNSVRIFMKRVINAESSEKAEEHFNYFQSSSFLKNDSLFIEVVAPNDSENIYYHTSISVEIPYSMNCSIDQDNSTIYVDQLNSEVKIEALESNIQIKKHGGSCFIRSSNQIEIEMIIPNDGYCDVETSKGDIVFNFPKTSNCAANIKSENGEIHFAKSEFVFDYSNNTSNEIIGTLGDGSASLNLYTKDGNIILNSLN